MDNRAMVLDEIVREFAIYGDFEGAQPFGTLVL